MNRPLVLTDKSGMQAGTPTGKWYQPITPDGVKTYTYSSSQPEGYDEVTQRNNRGELIGPGIGLGDNQVVRFNPLGPGGYASGSDIFLDIMFGPIGGTPYNQNGYDFIQTDEAQAAYMRTGAVENAISPLDVALALSPAKMGSSGPNMFRAGGETFYRSMSKEAGETLIQTGRMPAGVGETMISPTRSFAEKFDGSLFKFELNKGTTTQLESIGVRDTASANPFKYLPTVSRGWKPANAFFKVEGNQVNIGLGNGRALDIFNSNIKNFEIIPR